MKQDLLIEIGTEELPPKALPSLSGAFTQGIVDGLTQARIGTGEVIPFATPRRLAVLLTEVDTHQPDQQIERRGPAVQAAFDDQGKPTKAIEGFARSCDVSIDELSQLETEKGAWFVYQKQQPGQPTADLLEGIINTAISKMPIPKRMRWGDGDAEFVRPVHWLVCLFGKQIVDINVMGLQAGHETRGHRFHHPEPIPLDTPAHYESQLEAAFVIASFEKRLEKVRSGAKEVAASLGGTVIIDPELLKEVTALVEWPVPVAGDFEQRYLAVPQECLITTMEDNQKYFAVVDANNTLLPHFITTSNIVSRDVQKVKEGNERVIRPRFSDAEFFWEQDRKQPLSARIEATKKIIFQQQLGTLYDKTRRVIKLSGMIADMTGFNRADAERAAELSKCDLMTDMVGEFPKLQGVMGRYYALHDGENENIAYALEEQYMPRYAGDQLPQHEAGKILSLADRLDTLMGIFAIGQKPTGTKDPFALRRAALGVLRILIEDELDLDLKQLLANAAENLSDKVDAQSRVDEAFGYILERLNAYYKDQDIPVSVVDAIARLKPTRPLDFHKRVHAVNRFRQLEQAEALAAANKRIGNILNKLSVTVDTSVDNTLFRTDAEATLYKAIEEQESIVKPLFAMGDYTAALQSLANLRDPVDRFFDEVMVMDENQKLQNNRLAMLNRLRNIFLHIADLSVLQ